MARNGVFWLKLLLKCLKNKDSEDSDYGYLRFNNRLPYSIELLSKITRTDLDTVRVAMKLLCEMEMVELLPDETLYIEAINRMVGTSSSSTERVRRPGRRRNYSLNRM